MNYYSTNNKSMRSSLRNAVLKGLAADGGLFMPETITPLPPDWIKSPPSTLKEIAFDVARHLVGDDVPAGALQDIIDRAINFEVPVVPLGEDTWSLELFHGPTLAFKDFGARFLAGLVEYYASQENREILVLAATSGDTGSAVANGFHRRKGVRVVILYPSGKVSALQEKQLATFGENITAWEVEGTFDDCQRLVKKLFMDDTLNKKFLLTSANSINIARLFPQTFYYFLGWSQLPKGSRPVFSVPSGNFGNLTAGVIAKRLGLPVARFVAATNVNDVVPVYIDGGKYSPRASVATISNAMDVGDPSNFSRLLDLYGGDRNEMRNDIAAYSFSDQQTRLAMKQVLDEKKYMLDPHGAVAYLGLKKFRQTTGDTPGFFLETAHPAKFIEVVEEATGANITLPAALELVRNRTKQSVRISHDFEEARERLLRS
jgi:threonine synthase